MHIDKNDLIEFDNGTMNEQELIEFLSHLDHCDSCLDQMIEQENHSPVTAPSYLAEQIMDKAISSEVQFARAANKVSRKVQFLRYGLQTAAGVAAALLLLFRVNVRYRNTAASFMIFPEVLIRASVMVPVLWFSISVIFPVK